MGHSRAASAVGVLLISLAGCSPSADALDTPDADVPYCTDAACPAPEVSYVYAVEDAFEDDPPPSLYRINPRTFAATEIAELQLDGRRFTLHDIAINAEGEMFGCSPRGVYRVDPRTGIITRLWMNEDEPPQLNGLAFIPQADGTELLVATSWYGTVWHVSIENEVATEVGFFSPPYRSTGDLVHVEGVGTVATVHDREEPWQGWLAVLDPLTSDMVVQGLVVQGQLSTNRVYGLGYWRDRLFGFTAKGEILLIDPVTAETTVVAVEPGVRWAGAAVTTRPVIIE